MVGPLQRSSLNFMVPINIDKLLFMQPGKMYTIILCIIIASFCLTNIVSTYMHNLNLIVSNCKQVLRVIAKSYNNYLYSITPHFFYSYSVRLILFIFLVLQFKKIMSPEYRSPTSRWSWCSGFGWAD